ncbi:MAG: 4-hydroxy-3-methylbut-2-enyl diphosphate reductase [Candidatus Omnitrophica bacterium]|nr:4-hydroxy-3-methylbut-2-enyl diphosphate reductase [Candidatus Omnitrophota bacterium]
MALKINISEFSDFCFGVKRAISLAEGALKKSSGPVYSLGPLIHNQRVVNELSGKGLNVTRDYKNINKGTVVTRSHGIHPDTLAELGRKKVAVINATCPFVYNAQMIAKKLCAEEYKVVIVGDKGHPEVKSLNDFSGNKAFVISNKSDARKLTLKKGKIGVIAQTTQSQRNFSEVISELLNKDFAEIRVFNTICSDANMRQKSTDIFSRDNDVVFVVGGKNSANTKRLYEICKARGTQAHHIDSRSQIRNVWLKGKKRVGVVSGASTPRWIVDEVVEKIKQVRKEG